MTPAQLRSLAGLLLALAIVVGVWTSDLRQSNVELRQSVDMANAQLRRVATASDLAQRQAAAASVPETLGPQLSATRPVDVLRLHAAAAGYGSDARNMAAALQRMKVWCSSAGLMECVVRRSTLAAATSSNAVNAGASASLGAARPALTPYAVALVATFNVKGAQALLDKLAGGGFLYRVERINIVQNRGEWEVVFFHDASLRADATETAARASQALPSNQQSSSAR